MRPARHRLLAAALAYGVLASVLLVLGATEAAAEVAVPDLHRAEVIVTGTEEPERTRGFRAGLVDVIVKLTGDARLADSSQILPLLDAASSYVASFEYEDRMKGIPLHDEQGTRQRPHFLRIRFDEAAVDAALGQRGLTLWGSERPLLAVCLGIATPAGSYVLHDQGPEGYGQRLVILEHARRRGIPVALPATDGASGAIGFAAIAAADLKPLRAAMPAADAFLTGALRSTPEGYWDIDWRLDWGDATLDWTLQQVSFDTALKNGLDRAALVLSGHSLPSR